MEVVRHNRQTDIDVPPRGSNLQSSSAARSLSASRVSGDGGNILNAADLKSGSGKGAQGRLAAGAGGLGSVASSGSDLHVHSRHTQVLGLSGGVLGGKHGSIRRSLIAISLHLHATGDSGKGLTAGQVGDVLK